jgi:hypothetical protein
MSAFDQDALEAALEAEGIEYSRSGSLVMGSPYDYTFIEGPEPLIMVSDLREWEDRDGILVGVEHDGDGDEPKTCATVPEAVAAVKKLLPMTADRLFREQARHSGDQNPVLVESYDGEHVVVAVYETRSPSYVNEGATFVTLRSAVASRSEGTGRTDIVIRSWEES